ncbi:MAG TPA: aminoacyl-tRNA hydrolase [Patescibacteria group bacterium]|nr:aminoacyl-tRNA hydrolase [Patescibacteria group bacterium]
MKLLLGLGNPGEKYQKTRHNIGFMAVDEFLKASQSVKDTVWTDSKKFKSDIAELVWQPKNGIAEKLLLVKPKTYMNNSGMAARLIADFYHIQEEDIWVMYDDADLQLGKLRIRKGGGSAGHRGIESLLEVFPKGDFWRFRMGIGRPEELANVKGIDTFVLGEFTRQEHAKIRELLPHSVKAMEMALDEGLDAAMNKYNSK